jgi:hypothetical protein
MFNIQTHLFFLKIIHLIIKQWYQSEPLYMAEQHTEVLYITEILEVSVTTFKTENLCVYLAQHFNWCRHFLLTDFLILLFLCGSLEYKAKENKLPS